MPIKPENRSRYPQDWRAVSIAIRLRAGNACEGSPEFPDCRAVNGQPHPVTGSRVVLTVAHLDHTPENCSLENLKAWCQRCHLNYDRKQRKENQIMNKKTQTIHPEKQIVRCIFCGFYPDGITVESQIESLKEHIKTCSIHPLRKAEKDVATLRAALEGLLNASSKEDLLGIRELFMPGALIDQLGRGENNACSVAAIDALLSLNPQ